MQINSKPIFDNNLIDANKFDNNIIDKICFRENKKAENTYIYYKFFDEKVFDQFFF